MRRDLGVMRDGLVRLVAPGERTRHALISPRTGARSAVSNSLARPTPERKHPKLVDRRSRSGSLTVEAATVGMRSLIRVLATLRDGPSFAPGGRPRSRTRDTPAAHEHGPKRRTLVERIGGEPRPLSNRGVTVYATRHALVDRSDHQRRLLDGHRVLGMRSVHLRTRPPEPLVT